jgi:hypothetical protein
MLISLIVGGNSMSKLGAASIVRYFGELADPRMGRNRRHKLIDIIVVTVCAVISGCETWEDIEDYGKFKIEWLRRFLELPHGIRFVGCSFDWTHRRFSGALWGGCRRSER